jgi:hypothetical protein
VSYNGHKRILKLTEPNMASISRILSYFHP